MSLLNYKSNNNEVPTEEKEEDENLWYARNVFFPLCLFMNFYDFKVLKKNFFRYR